MMYTQLMMQQRTECPFQSFELTDGHLIHVVHGPYFDRRARAAVDCLSGRYYRFVVCEDAGRYDLLVTNAAPPDLEQIDRDDAWRRRLELASGLHAMLDGRVAVEPADLNHSLPLALLTQLYQEAFSDDSVLDLFFTNSQRRFEETVSAYLSGDAVYDTRAYARHGCAHPGYSHIQHLAWVYAQQIRLVGQALQAIPDREIVVLDLGTGGGHFLLTLAHHLAKSGQLSRVRMIGIDHTDRDMRFARKLTPPACRDRITFVFDDITSPEFADRLRRHRADVVVANHVLEHLPCAPRDIENRYLQDWLLAAGFALSISVPLEDDPQTSISDHVSKHTVESVAHLAQSMTVRVGNAVVAQEIEETKYGGLWTWVRAPEVLRAGGFTRQGVTLQPRVMEAPRDPILMDFAAPFDPAEFSRPRCAPKIGAVQNQATFARQGQTPRQVRQLLIKEPGGAVKLPGELEQFAEAVQIVIDHNRAANPGYERAYAYFNMFRGVTRQSAYRGLSLSCHGDQMQSLRRDVAYNPDWSYIVSSALPTRFYACGFDISEALARYASGESVNLYDYFNAHAEAAGESCVSRSDNFGIYLLSPYVVHSAAATDIDTERVFMKVAFSTKRFFDNRELRRNPAFDIQDWYLADTVGYIGGWLSHAHWNERFLDLTPRPF